ncbi:MAG: VOC family protein [Dehalococcoidales bacterium]|nr:VOC family protein [Dehalococcoidales bacterium]
MANFKLVHPTLPAVDINRARNFYEEKLGLKVILEDPSPGLMFKVGDCRLYIYQRGATKADHTVAEFEVDDIEAEMRELRNKGIEFEDVDFPGLKTVNGIATMTMNGGEIRVAWFKDTEGNILAIEEMAKTLKEKLMAEMAGARA